MKNFQFVCASLVLSLPLFFNLTGCSTAKVRVMPGENGSNRVVSADIERDGAEEAAVDAANDYCKKENKRAVFLKEDTKYTGSMDEGTRNTVRKASRVASMVGFQQRDITPGQISKPSPVETAGEVGSGMTNDRDYKSEMTFKCQ